jgi:hypothetical protein
MHALPFDTIHEKWRLQFRPMPQRGRVLLSAFDHAVRSAASKGFVSQKPEPRNISVEKIVIQLDRASQGYAHGHKCCGENGDDETSEPILFRVKGENELML